MTNPGKIGYTFPKLARTKEEYSRYSGKESARLVKGQAEAEGRSPFSHRENGGSPRYRAKSARE